MKMLKLICLDMNEPTWYSFLRIADAEENLGESEVREAHLAKALFFIRIADKVNDYNSWQSSVLLFVLSLSGILHGYLFAFKSRRKHWSNSR